MHLIELGKGNHLLASSVSDSTGKPGVLIRVQENHGWEIGKWVDGIVEPGMKPADTVITFDNVESAIALRLHVQDAIDKFDEQTGEESDCEACNGCQGESSSEPFEIPAYATGSDDKGDYRLIKLDSMPENWSHLRMYQSGDTVVVNKDFTERPAKETEVLGIMIFLACDRWGYVDEPVKSEYPKYVLGSGDWDIAYIEQVGKYEWSCVGKDRTRSRMFPGASHAERERMFKSFIDNGSWRYVTKAEAVSRLESQS
jgi:hypothetical protein